MPDTQREAARDKAIVLAARARFATKAEAEGLPFRWHELSESHRANLIDRERVAIAAYEAALGGEGEPDALRLLRALAASNDDSLLGDEADVDDLFDAGLIALHRDITDEYLTELTDKGRDAIRAALAGQPEVERPDGIENVDQELRERFELIERFAGALANPDCDADCEGSGIDREGAEWMLCECTLSKLERIEKAAALPDDTTPQEQRERTIWLCDCGIWGTGAVRCGTCGSESLHRARTPQDVLDSDGEREDR